MRIFRPALKRKGISVDVRLPQTKVLHYAQSACLDESNRQRNKTRNSRHQKSRSVAVPIEEWGPGWLEYYDEPTLEDLQSFREVLFRKYQRRRASFEDVQWADRELARRRGREETFHVGAPPGRFESPLKDNGGQDFDRH